MDGQQTLAIDLPVLRHEDDGCAPNGLDHLLDTQLLSPEERDALLREDEGEFVVIDPEGRSWNGPMIDALNGDPIQQRISEDDQGAAMADNDHDGHG